MARSGANGYPIGLITGVVVASIVASLFLFGNQISALLERAAGGPVANAASPTPKTPSVPAYDETPEAALQRIIAAKKIINVHEHAQGPTITAPLLEMMDKNGMAMTCLMGSSKFTLTLQESVGFVDYDANNEALLKMQLDMPDRFEAWPTINPMDPQKLEKITSLVQRGAKGVKLYLGHGYVRRDNGNYMFHTVAMDDPDLDPFFAFCEKNFVPVCLHVNPYLTGFAQELFHVLTKYPNLKANCPHFVLSSINQDRLREILDTFPNVYSDISFGHDDFLRQGMARISKNNDRFRKLINDYPDRFFFGTDLVLTDYEGKTPEWMQVRVQAYYHLLTAATYTSELLPMPKFSALDKNNDGKLSSKEADDVATINDFGIEKFDADGDGFLNPTELPKENTLRGLELRGPLLDNILYQNFLNFLELKPTDTKITREINWERMGVEKVDRKPGQAFPPAPKKAPGTNTKKKPFDPLGSINKSINEPLPQ